MPTKQPVIIVLLLLATLAGCAKKVSTTGETATLALKDGTTVTGTVTKSDTSSITIQTPAGVVSTYPLSQVSSVNYGPGPGSASNPPPADSAPQQQAAAPPSSPAGSSAAPSAAAPSAAPPDREYTPAETFLTIPAGTTLAVRTDQAIDSQTAAPGQSSSGVVARDVLDSNGQVAIPRGSGATLVIRDARAQGRVKGQSELVVDVAAVTVGGRRYRLETSDFVERGRQGVGANRRTAEFTGGGSVFGTIVGALAGGGKGAAIGALSGAAAGAATQSVTRGKGARIPAETLLNFRLEAPIRIREMR
ncbi:MAG TPA: hypothetical protein VEV17_10570 [Bryobacteraceae bacterium]|nr:hypothetical protein [Bryobacteraceae bacterium]